MSKREQILELRDQGKSYREIEKILGCSRSVIAYHCKPVQREKNAARTREFRKSNVLLTKIMRFKRLRNRQGQLVNGNVDFSYDDVLHKCEKNPVCYLTGRPIDFSKPKTYNLDHIVPVSKGGSREFANLGFVCKEVNQAKSDLLLDDFLKLCEDVLTHNGYLVKKI